jgi:hypothetical protein
LIFFEALRTNPPLKTSNQTISASVEGSRQTGAGSVVALREADLLLLGQAAPLHHALPQAAVEDSRTARLKSEAQLVGGWERAQYWCDVHQVAVVGLHAALIIFFMRLCFRVGKNG